MTNKEIVDSECLQVLRHHSGAVLNVKFSSNGVYCISTSQDKSLVLWNPTKGTVIKEYRKTHNHEILDVSITSDNSRFASCGGDKSAFLWDVSTGNIIRKFPNHNGRINCCEIAADNSLLFTGCYDKALRIFDLKSYQGNQPIQVIEDARDSISSLVILDDKRFIVGSVDGQARCYDIRAGRVHTDQFPSPVVGVDVTRDGRCYVASCLDSTIRLVELDSGQHLNIFRGRQNVNYALNSQISADDAYVVGGSEDGRLCIWDLCSNNDLLQELTPYNTSVSKDTKTFEELQKEFDEKKSASKGPALDWGCVHRVRFHPTQWTFLSCHNDKTIRLWKRNEES